MPPDAQQDACRCFFEPSDSASKEGQKALLAELAKVLKFRLVFLQRQTLEAKAKYLGLHIDTRGFGGFKESLLRNWLFYRYRPLLICLLSESGIPHEDGLIAGDAAPSQATSLDSGVKALLAKFPPKDVGLYLGYLLCAESDSWQELPAALERCATSVPKLLGITDK